MKNTLLLCSVVFFLYSSGLSQTVSTGCFHVGSSDAEYPKTMVMTYDGNYVIGGGSEGFGGAIDFYVVKTDPSGNIIWSNVSGGNFIEYFNDLLETSDHSIIGVGVNGTTGSMIVVKFDENGILQWSKDIDILSEEEAFAVVETEDGGLMIGGETEINGSHRGYLVKLDGNGDKVWEKLFRNENNPFGAVILVYALVRTVEDHYIAGCYSPSLDNFYCLTAFDKDGNYLWAKQSTNTGVVYDLAATPDSGFVMAGNSCFTTTCDAQLCKFDKGGNLEWSRAYGDSLNDIFYGVDITADGGIIAAGGADNFVNVLHGYIMKTDAQGNEEWSHILGDQSNLSIFEEVHQSSDGGYVAAGVTNLNGTDYFVAKFDANGNICDDCLPGNYGSELTGTSFTDITLGFEPDTGTLADVTLTESTVGSSTDICIEIGMEVLGDALPMIVFPNPSSSGIFEISVSQELLNAAFEVHDVTGKLLLAGSLSSVNHLINLSECSDGIYIFSVEQNNQGSAVKLVK